MTTKITKADGKPWGEAQYTVNIDGQDVFLDNEDSFYVFTNEEFLEKKKEIEAFVNAVLNDKNWNWGQYTHGLRWSGKRSLVQWAEDVVANEPIQRSGPVDS